MLKNSFFFLYRTKFVKLLVLTLCPVVSLIWLPQFAAMQTANYTISGNVRVDGANLAGATVVLSGSSTAAATTGSDGNYSLTAAGGGTYGVSVYKNGDKFDPASQTLTNLQANQTVNFQNGVPLCAPPSAGLAHWYRGEGSADDSVGGNNGTNPGAGYAVGKVNQAFALNGSTDYVQIPHSAYNQLTNAGSISLWLYLNGDDGSQRVLLDKGRSDNLQASYTWELVNGQLRFDLYKGDGTGDIFAQFPASEIVGAWANLTAAWDGAALSLYRNGVLLQTANYSFTRVDRTDEVDIGRSTNTALPPVSGSVDELQFYSRALSAAEAAAIYNAGSAGVCAVSTPTGAGTLDVTFNHSGKVTTSIGSVRDQAYGVVIQPDGKIVVSGQSETNAVTSTYGTALARYNPDGSLDLSFGTGGKVSVPINNNSGAYTVSLAIQSDGKLIAGGSNYNGSNVDFALVRFNSDGSIDSSFGTSGRVITTFGFGGNEAIRAVAIQSDGKIVAAGYALGSANNDFAVARYNPDGSLDPTFNTTGKVLTPVGSLGDQANAMKIQSDGKIVAAGGAAKSSSTSDFAVVRYNTNGSLDTSFGANGKVITPVTSGSNAALSVAVQSDGKVVATGPILSSSPMMEGFALVRYNVNGSLDSSFGTNGIVTAPVLSSADYPTSSAIQPDGKIIAAGRSRISSRFVFILVRYNTNGSLDSSFGSGGVVLTPIDTRDDEVYALAIQADGRIVAAGYADNNSKTNFALARYNADGSNVVPADNLRIDFSNVSQSGNTVAPSLTAAQIPALPNNLNLYSSAPIYDIRTSAVYTGNIAVTETIQNVTDSQTCDNLRIIHFENGAWTNGGNAAPQYNAGTMVCTLSQTVTSLSPFAVAQTIMPTAASATIGGRVMTGKGTGVRNARVTMIDANGKTRNVLTGAFGYYRFADVPAGVVYILTVTSKNYYFSQPTQVRNITEDTNDINFIAAP